MIKTMDIMGSLIVLSCYVLLAPISFLSFFAIFPFFFGVGISALGLTSHASQVQVRLYLLLAVGIFTFIFLFLWIILPIMLAVIYATPVLVASSSLIIAHFANNDMSKSSEIKGAPF